MIVGLMVVPSVLFEVVNIFFFFFWTFITLLKSSHMFKKTLGKISELYNRLVIHDVYYYVWLFASLLIQLFIMMMPLLTNF